MPTVNILGTNLQYVEQGSGEPLVFVHGSINDLRSWGQQLGPFSERYRVFAYTRRHHCGSEDPEMRRQLSVGDAAKDLVEASAELRVPIMDHEAGVAERAGEAQVASLLGDPAAARLGRAAGDVNTSAGDLDAKEHVVATQEGGLDGEEVAGDVARRLRAQELAPGRSRAARRRSEARTGEQPPDRARRNREAELSEEPRPRRSRRLPGTRCARRPSRHPSRRSCFAR